MQQLLHVIAFCLLTRTVWNAVLDRVVICTCMFEIGLVRVLALISSTLKPSEQLPSSDSGGYLHWLVLAISIE